MPVQQYNAEMVELLRSTFADKQQPNSFAYNLVIPWVDFPLKNTADGSHFNNNGSSYPSGWTEVDAALATRTNEVYGTWTMIGGGSGSTSWKYRRQGSVDIEADSASGETYSFEWGPIFWRDGQYPADLTYYFGVYADNAGSINENIFIRVALNWDASGGNWRVRQERKDGSTQTNGAWNDITQYPVSQPIYLRNVTRFYPSHPPNEMARSYIGSTPIPIAQTALALATMNVTWGQAWWQTHMTRSASGLFDYLYIGGVDRGSDA